jgi:hypothetical protein
VISIRELHQVCFTIRPFDIGSVELYEPRDSLLAGKHDPNYCCVP